MAEQTTSEMEAKWRTFWEKEKVYAFNPKGKKIFSVDTPPPTVSGAMHMGHAFSYAQQDFIVRYHRMKGENVLYPFGTDDNGLPTERLVEKLKNVKSKDMSRADFIKLCLTTLKEITPAFVQDWKNLGISADYALTYSTIDDTTRKISQQAFLDLYTDKKVYHKAFPTLWCPECQTAIAQAELEDSEKDTFFSTLLFTTGKEKLPIATTRPELLPACVAVFVNPADTRYTHLIGKEVTTPLGKKVPIKADESAQIDKGTGVLMICSYGDKYDADAIARHKLTPVIILNKDGTLNVAPYQGMKPKEARSRILKELKEKGLVTDQKQIKHVVNVHDKCRTSVEFLPTDQWFIQIIENKKKLITQGKKVTWYPTHMFKRYENWVNGLEWDWSISRDRHFGIPLPVWFCETCKETVVATPAELPVDPLQTKKTCQTCKKPCTPETKVLDTWATSSLSPQIVSQLVKGKAVVPFSLRPQAHDIIRTWAFYTIVRALYHENTLPWNDIIISGNVSMGGEKMSKSKGNGVDPQPIMAQYGADALRYWAATSKLGEDLDYQEKDIVTAQKFITKLKNAAQFIFSNLTIPSKQPGLEETDRLFLLQLNKTIQEATDAFESYEYSRAKAVTDHFFWKVFADNYIELVKTRVYSGSPEGKTSAAWTLSTAFLTLTKLFAPFTPYITEEIYQTYFKKQEKTSSIHTSAWPIPIKLKATKNDEVTWTTLLDIITLVRTEKSKAQKSMKVPVSLILPAPEQKLLASVLDDLKAVTTTQTITTGKRTVTILA